MSVDFRGRAAAIQGRLVQLRRTLHRIPEIGLDLPLTQECVAAALEPFPVRIVRGVRCSSITAVLEGAEPGPVTLVRGDMDALPIAEESGEPFASTNGNMHACGHDLHTAALIGAVRLLSDVVEVLPGTVVFMFQPGEEGYAGARVMLEEGLLEVAGEAPSTAFATHVYATEPSGRLLTMPGTCMASSNDLEIVVHGRGGHGSMPNAAIDPVPVLAEIVLALQSYTTRRLDVFDPVVLSVTQLAAGVPINAIPGSARLGATVRTLSERSLSQLERELPELAARIAEAHGAQAEARLDRLYPATRNDPGLTERSIPVLREAFGEERVVVPTRSLMGSEDFSFVSERIPSTFVGVGAMPGDVDPTAAPSNHSPTVRFDESVLSTEAAVLATLAFDALERGAASPHR